MSPAARVLQAFHGAEYDAPVEENRRPTRSLVLCSTPRCGSEMLYSGLAATGVLGTPLEWLNPATRRNMSKRWSFGDDLASYIGALHAHRTTADGLFSTKVHWEHLVGIRAEAGGSADRMVFETSRDLLEWLFPDALYVRIIRLDVDAQAISLWRASQSNVWSVPAGEDLGEKPNLRYSFETIERITRRLVPDAAISVQAPLTQRLRDERSEWLLQRYRRDRAVRAGR
jgi:LPS sulfotransferase NodH